MDKVKSKTDKCPNCGSSSVTTELNVKTGKKEKYCLDCGNYFKSEEVNNDK